jgi:hypothetical protein
MKQEPDFITYAVARFDVEASSIPPVWKSASRHPGRYRTDTTCLLIHDSRNGTSWEDCLETRGELIATDGRQLVRFELPCTVEVPASDCTVHGAGRTRAILLDSKALARAMKGKGRASVTITMREVDETYNVTVQRWTAGGEMSFGIPALPYEVGGQYHGTDYPQVEAVMPDLDRREATVHLNRDYLRALLDSSALKGDMVRIAIPTNADGSTVPAPVTVEAYPMQGETRRSRSVLMPVRIR